MSDEKIELKAYIFTSNIMKEKNIDHSRKFSNFELINATKNDFSQILKDTVQKSLEKNEFYTFVVLDNYVYSDNEKEKKVDQSSLAFLNTFLQQQQENGESGYVILGGSIPDVLFSSTQRLNKHLYSAKNINMFYDYGFAFIVYGNCERVNLLKDASLKKIKESFYIYPSWFLWNNYNTNKIMEKNIIIPLKNAVEWYAANVGVNLVLALGAFLLISLILTFSLTSTSYKRNNLAKKIILNGGGIQIANLEIEK